MQEVVIIGEDFARLLDAPYLSVLCQYEVLFLSNRIFLLRRHRAERAVVHMGEHVSVCIAPLIRFSETISRTSLFKSILPCLTLTTRPGLALLPQRSKRAVPWYSLCPKNNVVATALAWYWCAQCASDGLDDLRGGGIWMLRNMTRFVANGRSGCGLWSWLWSWSAGSVYYAGRRQVGVSDLYVMLVA